MKRILVIEDDQAILTGISELLKSEHYDVTTAKDGQQGYDLAKGARHDLILLDLMLPSMNGKEICTRLRQAQVQTPIIMLTSRKQESDKVTGLELGADDYVTKPFSVRELLARIQAVLRRQQQIVSEIRETSFGDVAVDFQKQEARKGKKNIALSAREFKLLKFFVEHEGSVVTRDMLLNDVWGYDATPTTRTVDNFILSLRKKLETNPSRPRHFITVHTAGYKFVR